MKRSSQNEKKVEGSPVVLDVSPQEVPKEQAVTDAKPSEDEDSEWEKL